MFEHLVNLTANYDNLKNFINLNYNKNLLFVLLSVYIFISSSYIVIYLYLTPNYLYQKENSVRRPQSQWDQLLDDNLTQTLTYYYYYY